MSESPRLELLGTRIAKHRARLGWTQQEVADRIGISRTALSHLEAAMRDPGERTVALLAGVFGLEPLELVEGTDYPPAKAERLPLVAARYTQAEHVTALLDELLPVMAEVSATRRARVVSAWRGRIRAHLDAAHDERERDLLERQLRRLDLS